MGDRTFALHVSGSVEVVVTKSHVAADRATYKWRHGCLEISQRAPASAKHEGTSVSVVNDVVRIDGVCSGIILNGELIQTGAPCADSVNFPIPDNHQVNEVHTDGTPCVSFSRAAAVAPNMCIKARGSSCVDLGSNGVSSMHIEAFGSAIVRRALADRADVSASDTARIYDMHVTRQLDAKAENRAVIHATSGPGCAIFKHRSGAAVLEINTKFT